MEVDFSGQGPVNDLRFEKMARGKVASYFNHGSTRQTVLYLIATSTSEIVATNYNQFFLS